MILGKNAFCVHFKCYRLIVMNDFEDNINSQYTNINDNLDDKIWKVL